ncbi:MAG: DNA polymerase, partial [Firmicutes bacterium]|nr:DNA polymerase [Bacillota bacterium]
NKGFLLCADYSQIELRILAHLSGDESMISAFTNNRDIHTETALKIFDVPDSLQIISDMRRIAKAVNFGIIYGISAFGLSNSLGVTTSEATKFIEKYFAQFPKIKAFLDGCRDFALEHGYVKTMYGRRRYLPELQSTNANMVQFGTRAAMNMPMQGTAADIIKSAMIDINKELKSNHNLKSLMIAQIHDELVFDVPENEVDAMKNLVKQCMENVIKLAVPLQVDISVKETL